MRKRLLTITIFCLLTSKCFASASLVQSNVGGSFTGSVGSGITQSSSAVGFISTTISGDLLVLIAYDKCTAASNVGRQQPVTGGGYGGTWSFKDGAGYNDGVSDTGAFIWVITNAPAMTPSQTTVTKYQNGAGSSQTLTFEFDLYEFSGIVNPAVSEVDSTNTSLSGGTPSVTFGITTVNTDLIIVAMQASGSNISAGSGYTLGFNATVATTGQMQYQLNTPPGATSASFSGGTEPKWGIVAYSFKATPSSVTSTKRRRGWIF